MPNVQVARPCLQLPVSPGRRGYDWISKRGCPRKFENEDAGEDGYRGLWWGCLHATLPRWWTSGLSPGTGLVSNVTTNQQVIAQPGLISFYLSKLLPIELDSNLIVHQDISHSLVLA